LVKLSIMIITMHCIHFSLRMRQHWINMPRIKESQIHCPKRVLTQKKNPLSRNTHLLSQCISFFTILRFAVLHRQSKKIVAPSLGMQAHSSQAHIPFRPGPTGRSTAQGSQNTGCLKICFFLKLFFHVTT
jgi:hypothetical protein